MHPRLYFLKRATLLNTLALWLYEVDKLHTTSEGPAEIVLMRGLHLVAP